MNEPLPPLRPYQEEGVRLLVGAKRSALLAFDMGLGKTRTVIEAADRLGLRRVLMLCPAVAKVNHVREWRRWQQIPRSVGFAEGRKHAPRTDVVIVNYDLVKWLKADLCSRRWDLLVNDEAHYLKNPKAGRTKAVYGNACQGGAGVVSQADRVWLLTGTPAPNGPHELWPHLRALREDLKPGHYWAFIHRWCRVEETFHGAKIVGVRDLRPLVASLKGWYLRKRKADVQGDLPSLTFDRYLVAPGKAAAGALAQAVGQLDPGVRAVLLGAHARVLLADKDRTKSLTPAELEKLHADLLRAEGHIAVVRRLTGMAKAPGVAAMARDFLDGGRDKLVIFFHHRDVGDALEDQLKDCGVARLDGSTTPAQRQKLVDRFQGDPACRVFLGQLQAASTAITLTAASTVLFAEASWVPAENQQAASRCHRIGQTRGVLARFVVLQGTIDEAVMAVVERKTAALAQLEEAA